MYRGYLKSYEIFESSPDEVCYIPENIDEEEEGYTRKDFIDLCNGDALKARIVFELCSWEHPSTVLDQWDDEDYEALEELRKSK